MFCRQFNCNVRPGRGDLSGAQLLNITRARTHFLSARLLPRSVITSTTNNFNHLSSFQLKIVCNVISVHRTQHIFQRWFLFKRPNEGWIVLSATNYLDIVRFCPSNSPLINFRSIKNILVLSPPHYAKYSDTEILTQWGWTYCGLCRGKINSQEKWGVNLIRLFQTRMEFHVLAAAVSIM